MKQKQSVYTSYSQQTVICAFTDSNTHTEYTASTVYYIINIIIIHNTETYYIKHE